MERFRVIKDHTVTLVAPNTATANAFTTTFDMYTKLNLESNYSAQNNPCTIADISSGALYIIYRQTDGTFGTCSVSNATMRLRFVDN
jgi:hypothetical protein